MSDNKANSLPVKAGDFFSNAEVRRAGSFAWTHHPKAGRPGVLCYAAGDEAVQLVNANPNVTCVITTAALAEKITGDRGVVVAAQPQDAYYRLHNRLFREGLMKVHQEHRIDPGAVIAPTAIIGRHVVIEKGVTIGHHVVVEDFSIIGEGTYVAPNVYIGSRGMQNTRYDGKFLRVEFAGGVKIGRNCEILASAIVQKPYHCEYTEIGNDVQISVKVNVAHNVKVGDRTMVAGNSQIGGNAVVEEDVWIGQSATICDGIRIGRGAQVKMGSVVVSPVKPGQVVSGNFAMDHARTLKNHARAKSNKG